MSIIDRIREAFKKSSANVTTKPQGLAIPRSSASVFDRTYISRERYNMRRANDPYFKELLPVGDKEIIKACNDIYYTTGIVRSAIDLMQEFASEGRFRHDDPK